MDQRHVIRKIKEHLESDGYDVWASPDGYGAGPDIFATKNDDEFIIEAIGETRTRNRSGQDITIALGYDSKKDKGRSKRDNVWNCSTKKFLAIF